MSALRDQSPGATCVIALQYSVSQKCPRFSISSHFHVPFITACAISAALVLKTVPSDATAAPPQVRSQMALTDGAAVRAEAVVVEHYSSVPT